MPPTLVPKNSADAYKKCVARFLKAVSPEQNIVDLAQNMGKNKPKLYPVIDDGKLGEIYHWRGAYLQDWIVDPGFPLTWHLRKEAAGYGPHGDLNSHSVDLARFLVGEISSVQCKLKTFIRERSLPDTEKETAFEAAAAEGKGEVTVDDASLMIVEFAMEEIKT